MVLSGWDDPASLLISRRKECILHQIVSPLEVRDHIWKKYLEEDGTRRQRETYDKEAFRLCSGINSFHLPIRRETRRLRVLAVSVGVCRGVNWCFWLRVPTERFWSPLWHQIVSTNILFNAHIQLYNPTHRCFMLHASITYGCSIRSPNGGSHMYVNFGSFRDIPLVREGEVDFTKTLSYLFNACKAGGNTNAPIGLNHKINPTFQTGY